MASTSETGHAKNVANIDELVSLVTSMGPLYNPSKASLKVPALQTLSGNARIQLSAVNIAISGVKNTTAARDVSFSGLSKYVARVANAVKATDTSEQLDVKVSEIVRKITGKRVAPKKTEEEKAALESKGEKVKEKSSSQMSYDSRLNNFDMLIKLVSGIPLYNPNEADLKVAALTVFYNDLKAKHAACIAAEITLKNARMSRDTLFYKPNTGLVDTALDIKTYIKSVFDGSSPQYKQVAKLKFIRKKS